MWKFKSPQLSKPTPNVDILVQDTLNKLICKVCESLFKDEEELKNHWTTTEIFCKTCQVCILGARTQWGNEVYPDDSEHEGHDWNVIKNKCHTCVFICKSS